MRPPTPPPWIRPWDQTQVLPTYGVFSLVLYIQSLLHYIENAQENKKNTILSYNKAENSKRIK